MNARSGLEPATAIFQEMAARPLHDAQPIAVAHAQNGELHRAYDGSNVLFRLLRVYGWGVLLNLGYFDLLSPFSLFSLPMAQRRLVRKAVHLLGLTGGERVLDVACGRGWSSSYIAWSQHAEKVVGMDLLPQHVHICRGLYGGTPRLEYREGDATNMPFDAGVFDAVICIEAAFHFDRAKFFTEASRVLRKGGRLVVVDFMWRSRHGTHVLNHPDLDVVRSVWHWNDFDSVDEYKQRAVQSGFTITSIQDWSFNVLTAFYQLCRAFVQVTRSRAGRDLLLRMNPQLKAIKPPHWQALERIVQAHDYARRHARYMALTVEKR